MIELYHADLADQTTTEAKQFVRRYWYRAVGQTIMERAITMIALPKRGTHGARVDRFISFWNGTPDDQLEELFFVLKPYFALSQHRNSDLNR